MSRRDEFSLAAGQLVLLQTALGIADGRSEGALRDLLAAELDVPASSPAATFALAAGAFTKALLSSMAAKAGVPAADWIAMYIERVEHGGGGV